MTRWQKEVVLDERYMDLCSGTGVWNHNPHFSGYRGVSRSAVLGSFWISWDTAVGEKEID